MIKVKKLNEHARIPEYADNGATGADLFSTEDIMIPPHEWKMIGTGIAIAPNMFCDMQIRPRSGLAAKYGITVLNSPGTIDSSYRGELKVVLINHCGAPYHIAKGHRIAQLVALGNKSVTCNVYNEREMEYENIQIIEIERAQFVEEFQELDETDRNAGGFGSSGF